MIFENDAIVAIKGIGGYLLICDASSETAIANLRLRKQRPLKPFALMYPSMDVLRKDAVISEVEKEALESIESPIVLLQLLAEKGTGILSDMIAPGLGKIGAMLPYTGLYQLLLGQLDRPVVATSANMTNAPIIYKDNQALYELGRIADYIVPNNRPIVIPQDDSVIQYSSKGEKRIILRKSRGFTPSFQRSLSLPKDQEILAFGADLKAGFSFFYNNEMYSSQYLGNLSSYDSQESYQHSLSTVHNMLNAKPKVILCDQHPDYASTRLAREFAKDADLQIAQIQHHEAHFAAVLEENELWDHKDPILGVIWDGTGFGADGNVWGGEFFEYNGGIVSRINHLRYFKHFAKDQFAKQCRLPLLSLTQSTENLREEVKGLFSRQEFNIYDKLWKGSKLWSSSMGRVFDAVAGLLGLASQNQYEGLAPMLLEQEARKYLGRMGKVSPYELNIVANEPLPIERIFPSILKDLKSGMEAGHCAARFHYTLASIILNQTESGAYKNIAFSGGVFQNALLIDLIQELIPPDINLYFHRELSPNDENISFGQIVHYLGIKKDLKTTESEKK